MDLKTYISDSPRGTATKLAEKLDVSTSYLSQMASGDAPISPQRAVEIENETEGKVTRKDLFPNNWHLVWPELANAAKRRRSTDKEAT
jgi:DNA-binding transcriptional regulator YdaS (Cro superfamily)